MARWIHEFRSAGERALTPEERRELQSRARLLAVRRWGWGTLSALTFAGGVLFGIAFAASGQGWGWALLVFAVVAGCYAMGWASGAEKLALLHRRTLRIGTVEEFRRVRGDETARRMWATNGLQEAKAEAEDEEMSPSTRRRRDIGTSKSFSRRA